MMFNPRMQVGCSHRPGACGAGGAAAGAGAAGERPGPLLQGSAAVCGARAGCQLLRGVPGACCRVYAP